MFDLNDLIGSFAVSKLCEIVWTCDNLSTFDQQWMG